MGRAAYWDNRGSPAPQNPGCSEFGFRDWTTKIIGLKSGTRNGSLQRALVKESVMNCKCGLPTGPQPSSFIPQGLHTCCSCNGNTLPKSLHGCHFHYLDLRIHVSSSGKSPWAPFSVSPILPNVHTALCEFLQNVCHYLALSCPWLFMLSLPTGMQAPWTED